MLSTGGAINDLRYVPGFCGNHVQTTFENSEQAINNSMVNA
jgi:hypothetical protein